VFSTVPAGTQLIYIDINSDSHPARQKTRWQEPMIASIISVDSVDIPGLGPYRTLKRPVTHREQGIFIAEGSKVVEQFLESELSAVSILLTPAWFDHFRIRLEERPEPIVVYVAGKKLLETIVSIDLHQGVMAVGTVPREISLEEAVRRAASPRLFVAVEHLASAENTGVLIRNCVACGVQAFIAGETSADPYLRRSVRNSMGTIFRLPVLSTKKLTDTLNELRMNHGFMIFAAHPRAESGKPRETDFLKDCCVVFGSEGDGLSLEVLEACTQTIAIPMASGVDSFNVACASAVILCEAAYRRSTGV
jgi:tRNA G18 (ribose-2'-O)-methylase SpoU